MVLWMGGRYRWLCAVPVPSDRAWRSDNAGPYSKGPSDMQEMVRGLNVLGGVCDSAAIAAPWAHKPCLAQGPASPC